MAGKGQYVFISYSSKNQQMADSVRMLLLENGIPCWMAPYDIPAGSKYAYVINDALENCTCLVLLLTNASQESQFVEREIERAITYKKPIIPMQLEDIQLNSGFKFYIGSSQIIAVPDIKPDAPEFNRIISSIQGYFSSTNQQLEDTRRDFSAKAKLTEQCFGEKRCGEETSSITFDREIAAKFGELFDTPSESTAISPLKKKLVDIKSRNFSRSIESRIRNVDSKEEVVYSSISLVPATYESGHAKSSIYGKHFTIPDVPGFKTIIFVIYKNIDYKTLSAFYTCEPLESCQKESDDGTGRETIYFVDEPHEEGDQLVLLHFNHENNETFINTGLLIADELRLSRKPTLFTFEQIHFDEHLQLSSSAYNLTTLSEDELGQVANINVVTNEQWRDADIGENLTIVVDPETALPVQRELYYDDDKKEWRARIKITSYKSYFAFQIRNEDTNSLRYPLTKMEIARYYKDGVYGFPKDVLKAAEYFEKDGSPQALYEISVLFRTDPSIKDEETYLDYLHQAIERGCEEASIEQIINSFPFTHDSEKFQACRLLDSIKEKTGLKFFLLGFFAEKGVLDDKPDSAFDYYCKSAVHDYKPACARLGIKNSSDTVAENIFKMFLSSIGSDCAIADYCMGCVLFFGLDIRPQKKRGLELLEAAALKGNKEAVKALYTICDLDSEYRDDAKALAWLKKIAEDDISLAIELSNRLLDGIGCNICEENDNLAFSVLQKVSRTGNKTALHNLGWMYKNGRCCEIDYDLARQLFMKAKKANSFYHLGDMYEQGLGVPADFSTAVQYYQEGAAQGSRKAIERLEELNIAVND